MPALTLADGTEYDKNKIVPYCYRAHLRPASRRRRDRPDGAARPDEPSQHQCHAPLLPDRGRPPPRGGRQGDRDGVRPARQPGLAGRARRCWTPSTRGTRSARSPSLTAGAASRPTSAPEAAHAPSGSAAPAVTISAPTFPTSPTSPPTSTTCSAAANGSPPPSTPSANRPPSSSSRQPTCAALGTARPAPAGSPPPGSAGISPRPRDNPLSASAPKPGNRALAARQDQQTATLPPATTSAETRGIHSQWHRKAAG